MKRKPYLRLIKVMDFLNRYVMEEELDEIYELTQNMNDKKFFPNQVIFF